MSLIIKIMLIGWVSTEEEKTYNFADKSHAIALGHLDAHGQRGWVRGHAEEDGEGQGDDGEDWGRGRRCSRLAQGI